MHWFLLRFALTALTSTGSAQKQKGRLAAAFPDLIEDQLKLQLVLCASSARQSGPAGCRRSRRVAVHRGLELRLHYHLGWTTPTA
jgi:hypothetical protein